jgi:DNA primase
MTVEELLQQKDIYYTNKGNDFIIQCLNPEHDDKNPSCRVDKITGVVHCFSCSFKGNIFSIFNIQRDRLAEKVYRLMEKIQDIKTASRGVEIPAGSIPFSRDFRGISASTYEKFEAFTNDIEFPDRVVFPIKDIAGRVAVLQGRHMFSKSNKDKYMNYPRKVPLFPFPQVISPIQGSIFIVEGLFDMLNLYDKGLTNTVCIFGVSTLSKDNIEKNLKNFKLQGVEKLYIMLDGDEAGRNASKRIVDLIKASTIFEVDEIVLDEDVDPGDLTKDEVEQLKRNIYED